MPTWLRAMPRCAVAQPWPGSGAGTAAARPARRQPRRRAAAARAAAARGAADRLRRRGHRRLRRRRDRRRGARRARRLRQGAARALQHRAGARRGRRQPRHAAGGLRRRRGAPHRQRGRPAAVHRQPQPPRLARHRGAAAASWPRATTRAWSRRRRWSCERAPRFAIGIDLGTTHCALASSTSPRSDGEATVHGVLPIPQLIAPGAVEARRCCRRSCTCRMPTSWPPGDWRCRGGRQPRTRVGELARSRGATTPIRLVSSAKSWLCHPGVDRRARDPAARRRPRWRRSRRSTPRCATSSTCAAPGTTRTPKRRSPSRT